MDEPKNIQLEENPEFYLIYRKQNEKRLRILKKDSISDEYEVPQHIYDLFIEDHTEDPSVMYLAVTIAVDDTMPPDSVPVISVAALRSRSMIGEDYVKTLCEDPSLLSGIYDDYLLVVKSVISGSIEPGRRFYLGDDSTDTNAFH